MILRADHVGLCVQNMERAIAFYRDVIGMVKVFDREFDATLAPVLGLPDAQLRVVKMEYGDFVLEMFDYRVPQSHPPAQFHTQWEHGITHIGFLVKDFWAEYQRLRDLGVEFLGEGNEIRPGCFVAYFRGPEGEVCEIREVN